MKLRIGRGRRCQLPQHISCTAGGGGRQRHNRGVVNRRTEQAQTPWLEP